MKYNSPVTLTVRFSPTIHGHYFDRLELVFEDKNLRQRFSIVKTYKAVVGNRADHELLRPKAPYKPRVRDAREEAKEVVPGVAAPALKVIPWVVALPQAFVPKDLYRILSSGPVGQVIKEVRRAFLPRELIADTYGRHFKSLLWCEEFRMEYALCFSSENA